MKASFRVIIVFSLKIFGNPLLHIAHRKKCCCSSRIIFHHTAVLVWSV